MNIPHTLEFRQELEKFLTQVGTQTKPMAISAGFSPDDHEWFLEAYAESNTALVIDTTILVIAIHRFLGIE
jgi:hypothetical protein